MLDLMVEKKKKKSFAIDNTKAIFLVVGNKIQNSRKDLQER